MSGIPRAAVMGGAGSLGLAVVHELKSQGWEVESPTRSEVDVCVKTQVEAWFLARPSFELLIHTVGIAEDALFQKIPAASWEHVVNTNVKSAFLCSQAAAQGMIQAGSGHIILLGSASAFTGPIGQASYAAAKAALIGLTQSLAAEWGKHQVRVNCVLPGWLEPSRMTASVNPAARARAHAEHVLGKWNTPQDAARFLVFLHSMHAVSGQVFSLDSRIRRA